MPTPIHVTIPEPCHENWQQMTPVEKGRFCASCQKKVFDFTNMPDSEIVSVLRSHNHVCGRLTAKQLEDGVKAPKERSLIGIAATAAAISLLTVGANDATAQVPVPTEQHEAQKDSIIGKVLMPEKRTITGIISDTLGPLPGARVVIKGTEIITETDLEGKYTIEAKESDTLEFSYIGYKTISIPVSKRDTINIEMQTDEMAMTLGIIIVRRTFFGRLFHRIGNWFR